MDKSSLPSDRPTDRPIGRLKLAAADQGRGARAAKREKMAQFRAANLEEAEELIKGKSCALRRGVSCGTEEGKEKRSHIKLINSFHVSKLCVCLRLSSLLCARLLLAFPLQTGGGRMERSCPHFRAETKSLVGELRKLGRCLLLSLAKSLLRHKNHRRRPQTSEVSQLVCLRHRAECRRPFGRLFVGSLAG